MAGTFFNKAPSKPKSVEEKNREKLEKQQAEDDKRLSSARTLLDDLQSAPAKQTAPPTVERRASPPPKQPAPAVQAVQSAPPTPPSKKKRERVLEIPNGEFRTSIDIPHSIVDELAMQKIKCKREGFHLSIRENVALGLYMITQLKPAELKKKCLELSNYLKNSD